MTILVILAVIYLLFHGYHYAKRRRRGLSVWMSLPGPWGTRISKRL